MSSRNFFDLFHGKIHTAILTSVQNIFYTVGFRTTARRPKQIGYCCVLMNEEETVLFCPKNWEAQVREQVTDPSIKIEPYGSSLAQLTNALRPRLKETPVGYERDGMELELYLAITEAMPSLKLMDISHEMSTRRMIKDPGEILALRKSAKLAAQAMEYAKETIRPGITELDLVAELEYFMRQRGSERMPFEMNALSGEKSVRTTNMPGEKRIVTGEIVLLDFGCTIDGYSSDWTRSFVVGEATAEQLELYQLVWKIERECIDLIRPGISLKALMEKAYEELEGHRFARGFMPHLGHSVGINSHEWPIIDDNASELLQENMVITIEPGVYMPGIGGIRIEDEVLVTSTGYEILTGLSQEEFSISI